jgi:hypothetical protein
MPHEREHPGRDRWFSAEEIRVLQAATVEPWWPVYSLLICIELRWSEAAGLIWPETRLAERWTTLVEKWKRPPRGRPSCCNECHPLWIGHPLS